MASTPDLENLPGVGPATAEKLIENDYDTFKAIAVASPSELSNKADVGESTASDVIEAARDAADIGGFETGADVMERREQIGRISTNVEEIDALIGGGVETQAITEVYGEFGSGKSQISHQMVVNVQLPEEAGGIGQDAIFIDTEDTFRPGRVAQMVKGLSDEQKQALLEKRDIEGSIDNEDTMDELIQSVLDHIHIAKAFNSNHQIMLLKKAMEMANEAEEPIGLLIVDSLTAHFRAEYVGRGNLADRQQKLNKHLSDISRFMNLQNAAVVYTNQVSSNPDSFFGDPTQPIGGNILGHKSTVRLYLKKSKGTKRIVKLVDSPDQPEGEAILRIEDAGVVDE